MFGQLFNPIFLIGVFLGCGGGYRFWLTSQIMMNCAGPQTDGATRFTKSTNISMMASGTSFRGVLGAIKCIPPPASCDPLRPSFLGGEKNGHQQAHECSSRFFHHPGELFEVFCFQKTTFKMIQLILLVIFNSWLFMDMMVQKFWKPRAPPVMAKYIHPFKTSSHYQPQLVCQDFQAIKRIKP